MDDNYQSRMRREIATIVILLICLGITTYALVKSSVELNNNLFNTGRISLEINNGKPLQFKDVNGNEITCVEPGMDITAEVSITNTGSGDMWYRVYFDEVSGELVDSLKVTVKDGTDVLYTGRMDELTRITSRTMNELMEPGEVKYLTVELEFIDSSDNQYQSKDLSFVMKADATQVKNNPKKEFE